MHFGFQQNPLSVIQNRSGMQNNFPSNFLLPPRLACINQFCLLLFTGRLRKWRNAISAHQKNWVMGSGFWKSCHAAPKHTFCNLLLAGFPLVKRRQLRNNFVAIPQKSCTGVPPLQKNTTESWWVFAQEFPSQKNLILFLGHLLPFFLFPQRSALFVYTHAGTMDPGKILSSFSAADEVNTGTWPHRQEKGGGRGENAKKRLRLTRGRRGIFFPLLPVFFRIPDPHSPS